MDWLISRTDFSEGDANAFDFHIQKPFVISAINIQRTENGKVEFQQQDVKSEQEYWQWIKRCRPPSSSTSMQPKLLLSLHKRLEKGPSTGNLVKSTALPYSPGSFQNLCKALFQHRTLAWLVRRASTTVFNHRFLTWESPEQFGRCNVYHCKSDNSSLEDGNDIILSATCFFDKPLVFAVMYGLAQVTIDDIKYWLEKSEHSPFHPLVLPMIFAELERSRFLNAVDSKETEIEGRILELERRVSKDKTQESAQRGSKSDQEKTMTERDCDAIALCRSISSLRNGLAGLIAELESMRDHLHDMTKTEANLPTGTNSWKGSASDPSRLIDAKLKAMIAELQSKIRTCEGHLGAMTLATQMEWNYYTRRDAQVNYSIATAAKMDGSQMKQISLLGMIFLPGTFLATFFSMTFFKWLPESSTQVASPWISLYVGLTVVFTTVTFFWLNSLSNREMATAKVALREELERDTDFSLFSKLTFSRSSSTLKSGDIELGVLPR